MSEKILLKTEVKPLKVNAGSPIRQRDFSVYIENPDEAPLTFSATLDDGKALPEGLSLSSEGVFSGTAGTETARNLPYQVIMKAEAPDQAPLEFDFSLYIFKTLTSDEIGELRLETWRELADKGALPENMQEVINRPITPQDVYHLLERFATFTVWNADDLRLASQGEVIEVDGASPHYRVYDFDVCLVATPKELYSHDRVMGDALETARAMIRNVHKRGWNVEFGGFDRMATAAWYEARRQNVNSQHQMEVRNYKPTDAKVAKKKAAPATGGK